MPTTNSTPATIESLRTRIAAIERQNSAQSCSAVLPFGINAIDSHLPGGGLRLGAMHELHGAGPDIEVGAAPTSLAASVLARLSGPVLWIGRKGAVFGHGLVQAGLAPRRVVFVDAGRDVPGVMEDALRFPGLAGVVAELDGTLDGVVSRRLQLAAEGSSVLGVLIRRSRRFDDPALGQPSAAATRWRVGVLPSRPAPDIPNVPGLCRPLWQLELLRCRGGEGASWIVEGADAQGRLALAAVLAHRPVASARRHAAG